MSVFLINELPYDDLKNVVLGQHAREHEHSVRRKTRRDIRGQGDERSGEDVGHHQPVGTGGQVFPVKKHPNHAINLEFFRQLVNRLQKLVVVVQPCVADEVSHGEHDGGLPQVFRRHEQRAGTGVARRKQRRAGAGILEIIALAHQAADRAVGPLAAAHVLAAGGGRDRVLQRQCILLVRARAHDPLGQRCLRLFPIEGLLADRIAGLVDRTARHTDGGGRLDRH